MKIRKGFVSNSSSSSFFVFSDKRFTEDNILEAMGIQSGTIGEKILKDQWLKIFFSENIASLHADIKNFVEKNKEWMDAQTIKEYLDLSEEYNYATEVTLDNHATGLFTSGVLKDVVIKGMKGKICHIGEY